MSIGRDCTAHVCAKSTIFDRAMMALMIGGNPRQQIVEITMLLTGPSILSSNAEKEVH
jgi:hypothetical protein